MNTPLKHNLNKKVTRLSLLFTYLGAIFITNPAIAFAANKIDPAITKGDGTGGGIFNNILIPFTNFLAAAVGIIVVISIIIGAIEYSSAGGDPNKVAKARGRIQKAVVSLIIFFFLYAILQWIVPGGIGG